MSDPIDSMMALFAVDYSSLDGTPEAFNSVFGQIVSIAGSASASISEELSGIDEGFTSLASNAGENTTSVGGSFADLIAAISNSTEQIVSAISGISDGMIDVENSIADMSSSVTDSIDQLASTVETGAENIADSMSQIGTSADDAGSQAEGAFTGFDLSGMINQVGMGIFAFQGMVNMAEQTATAIVGPAMSAEQAQESFTNLLGSTKAASDELSQLSDFASKTQFKTQDIDTMASSMLGFGFKAKEIVPDLTSVGDALTAVGRGTPAEMQSVVNLLGKMSSTGKVTGADITELGAHGINALQLIAEGSGKTTAEIQKMITDGTLPAKQGIDDLTKGIESNPIYAGGMGKQAGTLSGLMSTLSSDFDHFMSTLISPALPELETGFNKLITLIQSPQFHQFAVTVGGGIVMGLKDFATGIKTVVDDGEAVYTFFKNNQTALNALEAVLLATGIVIASVVIPALIGMAIAELPVMIETLATAGPFILLGLVIAAVVFGAIEAIQHWGAIMAWFGGIFGGIGSHIGDFFSMVGTKTHELVNDVGEAFSNLGSKIHDIWQGIWDHIRQAIDWIIGGINAFIGGIDSLHISIPGGATVGFNIPKIPLLALGGDIAAGAVGIAGEAGPELVFGGSGGAHVVSAAETASLLSGGGSSGDTHIHVYLDGNEITNMIGSRVVQKWLAQGPKKTLRRAS